MVITEAEKMVIMTMRAIMKQEQVVAKFEAILNRAKEAVSREQSLLRELQVDYNVARESLRDEKAKHDAPRAPVTPTLTQGVEKGRGVFIGEEPS